MTVSGGTQYPAMPGGIRTARKPAPVHRRRPLATAALLVASIALALVAVEIFLRGTGLGERNTITAVTEAIRSVRADVAAHGARPIFAVWEPHPRLGWRCRKNAVVELEPAYYEERVAHTNSFHMLDFEPDPRRRFVFVVGDSFVEGLPVPRERHFTHLLEDALPAYEFLNFGVSGYGSVQSYLHVRERLQQFVPDHVIFAVYLGNDFVENDPFMNNSMIGLAGYDRETIPFLSRADTVVYGADSYGPIGFWLARSRVSVLAARSLVRAGLVEADGLEVAKRILALLARDLDARGIGLSVLLIPDDATIHATDAREMADLDAHARALGIHVISLLDDFRRTGNVTMGYADADGQVLDPHWDTVTHRLVADVVMRESADVLPSHPRRSLARSGR